MWFDEDINCMQCNKGLILKKSSYWVVPGSGSLIFCDTCFNVNGINHVDYIHQPVHYTKGVCDKEE